MMCIAGRTALHWAAAVNNEEAAQALICHHANVDAQDEYSQTALFLAAREGSYQVAKILLHHGKANTDLPDHMERFPRDIALERQHHDIAQLIDEFSRASGGITTLTLPQTSIPSSHSSASGGKSRSKKASATSQRKQSARADANREDDRLVHWRGAEADSAHRSDHVVRPKKTKRPRVPSSAAQSISQSQLQSAAKLYSVLHPGDVPRISPEQPPSYENAINGRRAQLAVMQQAAGMGAADSHPIYHTRVAFEDPQQASPEMAYGGMIPSEIIAGSQTQPSGMVLLPSSYLSGGMGEADPNLMVHNSPTVPSCHAYSPQNMAALQGPEATMVSSGQHHRQPLSPVHQQMLQQRLQHHQNNLRHHRHQQPNQATYTQSDGLTAAYISTVAGATAYTHPPPSSFQFPTPPSHHSTTETSPSLIPQNGNTPPNGYPTPSPEASDYQWSSSPNSAKSEWSEHAQNGSPKRVVANVTKPNIKDEPAYL